MISFGTVGLLLDAAALTISAVYLAVRLRDRRVVIDHRILFTIGHAYYLSLPLIMGQLRLLNGQYDFVWSIFDRIPEDRILLFSTWSLALLIVFHIGCMVGDSSPLRLRRIPSDDSVRSSFWVAIVAAVAAYAIFTLVVVINVTIILSGYRSNDPTLIQSQTGRGTLAAAATLVGVLLLYARSRLRDVAWPIAVDAGVARHRNILFGLAFAPVAMTLLLAGGRLYATTMAVAAIVWIGVSVRPLRRSTIILVSVAAFGMLTAYGSLRTGDAPNADDMQLFATTESVQGSIALFNTLEMNDEQFDAVRIPVFLASDMVNLVPRVLLPGKDDLRVSPEERGFVLDNPLGGLNVAVSLLINFGSVGSLTAIFLLGWGLSRLRRASAAPRSTVYRVSYSIIAATMLMIFYRDLFAISIVRWWILTALIVPAGVTAAMQVFARRRNAVSGEPRYGSPPEAGRLTPGNREASS